MIELTERDRILLETLAVRGWCSVKYLTQHFPSHQAALQRLITLEKAEIIERYNIKELINKSQTIKNGEFTKTIETNPVDQSVLELGGYYTNKTNLVKLNKKVYEALKLKRKATTINPKLMVHQLYQEYAEMHFKSLIDGAHIESNPEYRPRPDLFFEYNSKKYVVEIERRMRKPKHTSTRQVKGKMSARVELSYQDYIDGLLMFSDRIIYLFETESEHLKFKKESYSKRVYSTTITKINTLTDHENNQILTSELLNG